MSNLLDKTTALRAEAWAALKASPNFHAFKVMDDAVVALGGTSAMPADLIATASTARSEAMNKIKINAERRMAEHKRLSQADAAAEALKAAGEPLPVGRFMEAAVAKGANLTGANSLANFRSAVSKDKRFRSIKRNGMYFWWFTGSPVPQGWNEAPDLPLQNGSGASGAQSSQEGGESHAAISLAS